MKLLGNIIWIILGGLMISMVYIFAGVVSCLTIIGIPFGWQLFKLGLLALTPYGQQVVTKPNGNGCLNTIFNLIWIFTGGITVCLLHLVWGLLLCLTIIGIPFGRAHFKLMALAFTPFGKTIV